MSKSKTVQLYCWQGKNKYGKKIKGEQEAAHMVLLKADLRKQGILVTKVYKKSKGLFLGKKINAEDIRILSRQITTMLVAGISFVQALEIIEKEQSKSIVCNLVSKIKNKIETGASIAEALKQYPKQFNSLYCSLVSAGENSGTLEVMFERVTTYQEKLNALKNKIKKALFYPAAVITVAVVVTVGLLVFVVPQFEALFNGFGAQLPAATQTIINVSRFLQEYGLIILLLFVGMILGFIFLQKRSLRFCELMDNYRLRLPLLGEVLKKSAIARFARTLATLFSAGLPLMDALNAVAGATGNRIYNKQTLDIREQVMTGQTLQFAMRQTNLFPSVVLQMIAIGEASGTLESMLNKVAAIFEEEVDYMVSNLTNLLEPLIMIILGILIGGLVIAMYLPIFKLGNVV